MLFAVKISEYENGYKPDAMMYSLNELQMKTKHNHKQNNKLNRNKQNRKWLVEENGVSVLGIGIYICILKILAIFRTIWRNWRQFWRNFEKILETFIKF